MEYNTKNNYNNPYIKRTLKNKKQKSMRRKVIVLFVIMLLLVGVIILKKVYIDNIQETNNQTKTSQKLDYEQETSENISQETKNIIIVDITENDDKEDKQNTSQDTTVEKNEEEIINKDNTNEIKSGEKVGLDYFKDAVFIGDSRTEGFIINNGLDSKTTAYTYKGLQVNTIFTNKVINMDGKKVTIMEALENTSFSKVYIMLGINETGWVYNDLFIKKYGEIIDEIKRINPNCKIYVQSILPVSQKVSDEHQYIKNAKINEYNSLIENMAKEKNVYYIDVKKAVVNQNNVLPDDAATDGIHLNRKYCEKWLEYLTNHVEGEN